ncbi:MAG TPA: GNAT family N-acetyltransferase [Bacillota bacterium]|nr:GNAT family N-acetyltransferase [Bacillota bacterium]
MEIIFEKAKLDDALELIEVQNLSFQADFEKYGECPSYQETPENMRDMIQKAIVYKILVCERENNRLIGDIIIRKRADGSYYLRTIAIIPSCQSLGIGTKAMAFMEQDNPGGTFWCLTTPEGTPRNRHFYEKLGYHKVGEYRRSERLTLIEYKKEL